MGENQLLPFDPESWAHLHSDVIACRRCPRLVAWREEVARVRRRAYREVEYWGKPVPGFGDPQAQVWIVGLAPGAHGANRTGRMFTGDGSGSFLYRALHKAGFANQPSSLHPDDGLRLSGVYISAVCRCAPPDNRPTPQEIASCLEYLDREWLLLSRLRVIVALGQIAFDGVLRLFRQGGAAIPRLDFAHNAIHHLGDGLPLLVSSYHPSRQNTQTGRLTETMFDAVWTSVRQRLEGS